jgi:class 3 adenylate cyclase
VLSRQAQVALNRAEEPPILATVLFTDIVGSTERLAAMGDRAWRDVLERHNTLVRRELAQWRGREVKTTGDGFLAWFDSPAQGIRCAVALGQVLAGAGITIRAGLHTGECQVSGDDLTGMTVHIAARVSALADGGDVLVSRTVRDLVAGAGFAFADRGAHELKGVEGTWELFAVSSS